MSARKLHDKLMGDKSILASGNEDWQIIFRALGLLVASEESGDELVLDLLAAAKLHRLAICYKAAAALVALRDELTDVRCKLGAEQIESATLKAAKEKAEADLVARERTWNTAMNASDRTTSEWRRACKQAEAERDELKRHAEAMAEELQWIACRYDDSKSTRECAADAYEMKSAAAQALHAYRAAQEKS